MDLEKLARVLTEVGRKHIKEKNFAIPDKEKYPIHDIAHARNALARVAQHGTPEEQKQVRARVYAKYPSLRPASKTAELQADALEIMFKTAQELGPRYYRHAVEAGGAELRRAARVGAYLDALE